MHRSTGNCKKERKKEKKKGNTHRREEAAKEAKSRSRRRRRRLGLHCRLLVVIKCAEKKGKREGRKGRGNGCWKGGNERVWGWQRDGIFAAANHFSASQQQFSSFIFIHFKKQ